MEYVSASGSSSETFYSSNADGEGLSSTTELTRASTSDTVYDTRVSTSSTVYDTRASTSQTVYGTRASTSNTVYGTKSLYSTASVKGSFYYGVDGHQSYTISISNFTSRKNSREESNWDGFDIVYSVAHFSGVKSKMSFRRTTQTSPNKPVTYYATTRTTVSIFAKNTVTGIAKSTTGTTYQTRVSTSGTSYLTRSSTSATRYLTRSSTYSTRYLTRSSTSGYSGVSSSSTSASITTWA